MAQARGSKDRYDWIGESGGERGVERGKWSKGGMNKSRYAVSSNKSVNLSGGVRVRASRDRETWSTQSTFDSRGVPLRSGRA
jgi:hypothetical protein